MENAERMGLREWSLILILSIIWGSSFLFMGILIKELPPLTITALRLSLAALALNLIPKERTLKFPWRELFILGLTNSTIPYALILWGQVYIASSLASILNSTSPFLTSLLAHFLTEDEKLTKNKVSGVIIGFSGTLLMLGPDALRSDSDLVGQLMVLSGVLCYSYATVFAKKLYGVLSPLAIASGQLITAALTSLPLAIILEKPWTLPNPSASAWASLMGLSFISTALAYVIFFEVLGSSGATQVNLVTLLIPVTATLLCTTLLGEVLECRNLLGMVIILTGLSIVDGRLPYLLRKALGR